MSRIGRLVALSLLVVLSLLLVNVANARGLLVTTKAIEGRVTAVNAVGDQPTVSLTTDTGAAYLLRAPEDPNLASTKPGSRIRAEGTVVDGVFQATSVQKIAATGGVQNSVAMQQTTVVGEITEMNTGANPPIIVINTGTDKPLTVTLPGSSRVADLQIGESITATGTQKDNTFTATSFTILSRPLAEQGGGNEDGNGNDNSGHGNDNGDGNDNNHDHNGNDNTGANDNGGGNDNHDGNGNDNNN